MSIRTVTHCVVVTLGCAFACFAPEPEPELLETEVTEQPEESALGEPADEEFRVSYSCAGGEEIYEFTSDLTDIESFGDDGVEPFYCLTRCEGHFEMSRANKTKVKDPSKRTDSWCLSYAAYYCSRLKRELESWCWGMPDEGRGGGRHDDD